MAGGPNKVLSAPESREKEFSVLMLHFLGMSQ